jgi:hypothetical protein
MTEDEPKMSLVPFRAEHALEILTATSGLVGTAEQWKEKCREAEQTGLGCTVLADSSAPVACAIVFIVSEGVGELKFLMNSAAVSLLDLAVKMIQPFLAATIEDRHLEHLEVSNMVEEEEPSLSLAPFRAEHGVEILGTISGLVETTEQYRKDICGIAEQFGIGVTVLAGDSSPVACAIVFMVSEGVGELKYFMKPNAVPLLGLIVDLVKPFLANVIEGQHLERLESTTRKNEAMYRFLYGHLGFRAEKLLPGTGPEGQDNVQMVYVSPQT